MDVDAKSDIVEYYKQYFYTTAATSDELKNNAYKLRYEAYKSYYGIDQLSNIKRDEFDIISKHCLLFHKSTNQLIGCIRLIPYNERIGTGLPIEVYCNKVIQTTCDQFQTLDKNSLGELSRFSISPDFKRRKKKSDIEKKNFERRYNDQGFLLTCLILASINLILEHRCEKALALMEDRLAIVLKRSGVVLDKMGNSIDLHGKRTPYLIDPKASYLSFKPENKALFNAIKSEYKKSLNIHNEDKSYMEIKNYVTPSSD